MEGQKLQTRLDVWGERLTLVERALAGELEKEYFSRKMEFLLFLDREKRICACVISELRALSEDAGGGIP